MSQTENSFTLFGEKNEGQAKNSEKSLTVLLFHAAKTVFVALVYLKLFGILIFLIPRSNICLINQTCGLNIF